MDIVRRNLWHIIGDESILSVAGRAGIEQSWLQRFLNPNKASGIKKPNPEHLAAVAKLYGLTFADLMAKDLTAEPPTMSQSPRLDVPTIMLTMESMRIAYRNEGRAPPDLENPEDADDFARGYARAIQMDSPVSATLAVNEVIMLKRRGDHGRGEAGAVGGVDSDRPGKTKKRARKAS